jgi:hypothetical protein
VTHTIRPINSVKKTIDALQIVVYYLLNTGKEVIKQRMNKHSEVAET